jgi:hypothetical protein
MDIFLPFKVVSAKRPPFLKGRCPYFATPPKKQKKPQYLVSPRWGVGFFKLRVIRDLYYYIGNEHNGKFSKQNEKI